ncbi:hypothetical protein J7L33_04870 [Candidatus Bathyarchaeota archaeon]|nr:hypothetical protein [Candidatus Bathyarchaeota archaeon]
MVPWNALRIWHNTGLKLNLVIPESHPLVQLPHCPLCGQRLKALKYASRVGYVTPSVVGLLCLCTNCVKFFSVDFLPLRITKIDKPEDYGIITEEIKVEIRFEADSITCSKCGKKLARVDENVWEFKCKCFKGKGAVVVI